MLNAVRLAQRVILGCAILAALPCHSYAQQASAASNDERLHSLVANVQKGQFKNALAASEIALRLTPNDYRVWTLRGMAYSGMQNQASALNCFEHALKLAHFYLPALEGAAQLKYRQGNEEARPLLLRILTERPNDPVTHAMLAVLDYKKKDYVGAVSHFQQAGPSISSQPDAIADYGRSLAGLRRFQQAVPIFAQALALDPSNRSVRYDLALAQSNAGQPEDALATLQPLLVANPGDEAVLLLAADLDESTGKTQQAIDLLRKAILANPKGTDAYLHFADLAYNHGSPKIGIDFLNAGLTQLPKEPRLYLVRGVLLCQLGEFTKALDDFEMANRLDPKLSYIDVAMGIVESQQHKSAAALAQFRAAAKSHPNQAFTQYLLAEALSEQENPNLREEVEAATRAIRLDPKLVAAHDLLAGIYLQQGSKQLAIAQCEAALAVKPDDQQALYHLVLAIRNTSRKNEIPALMKRMNQLRQAQSADGAPGKKLDQLNEAQTPR